MIDGGLRLFSTRRAIGGAGATRLGSWPPRPSPWADAAPRRPLGRLLAVPQVRRLQRRRSRLHRNMLESARIFQRKRSACRQTL